MHIRTGRVSGIAVGMLRRARLRRPARAAQHRLPEQRAGGQRTCAGCAGDSNRLQPPHGRQPRGLARRRLGRQTEHQVAQIGWRRRRRCGGARDAEQRRFADALHADRHDAHDVRRRWPEEGINRRRSRPGCNIHRHRAGQPAPANARRNHDIHRQQRRVGQRLRCTEVEGIAQQNIHRTGTADDVGAAIGTDEGRLGAVNRRDLDEALREDAHRRAVGRGAGGQRHDHVLTHKGCRDIARCQPHRRRRKRCVGIDCRKRRPVRRRAQDRGRDQRLVDVGRHRDDHALRRAHQDARRLGQRVGPVGKVVDIDLVAHRRQQLGRNALVVPRNAQDCRSGAVAEQIPGLVNNHHPVKAPGDGTVGQRRNRQRVGAQGAVGGEAEAQRRGRGPCPA